ncbi:hypothetical protein DFJ77DRAFT_432104 [Powellomyces hirtus]|nr:hypothetical protein DFJ77DRAFT_432104 [Powellomyces hirtus]
MVHINVAFALVAASAIGVSAQRCNTVVNTRMNWNDMSAPQQAKYVSAVKLLHTPNAQGVSKLDEYGHLHHLNFVNAHQRPHTLPWHRQFLRQYELDLQRASNDSTIFVPYWDWSLDSQNPGAAKVLNIFGHNGNKAARNCVTDGAFANWSIKMSDSGTNAPAHCMTRNWNNTNPANDMAHLPPFIAPEALATAFREKEYDLFRQKVEAGGHNHLHNAFGGDMASGWSCTDPIFWLHHAFIDKLWAMWQANSGTPNAYNAVKDPLAGRFAPEPARVSTADILKPFNVAVSTVFSTTDNCYVYSNMNTPSFPRVSPKVMSLAENMVANADLAAARTGEANIFAANATHNTDAGFLQRPVAATSSFIKKWGMNETVVRAHEAEVAKTTRVLNALSTLKGGFTSSAL